MKPPMQVDIWRVVSFTLSTPAEGGVVEGYPSTTLRVNAPSMLLSTLGCI
jgi:hypothetical protein